MRAFQTLLLIPIFGFNINQSCSQQQGENFFYDTSIYDCSQCPENQIASESGYQCQCDENFAKTADSRDLPVFECSTCGQQVPSSDNYICQSCQTYNNQNTECLCPEPYSVISSKSQAGEYLDTKQCIVCANKNLYPGPDAESCEACPHNGMIRDANNQCRCDSTLYRQAGNSCILLTRISDIESQFPLDTARQIIYPEHETSRGTSQYELANSNTIDYFYLNSAYGCSDGDIQSCQNLGNLCVLQLYNEQSTICKLFNNLGQDRESVGQDEGWKKDMPWLYYRRSAEDVLEGDQVQLEVTFDPDNSDGKVFEFKYRLAIYNLDGSFNDFIDLTDELILCPHSSGDAEKFKDFGTNIIYDCNLDLESFITTNPTAFYELYFEDLDQNLLDVPVLVKNFIDANGDQPNDSQDEESWRLTRRFFIYDNVSGKIGSNAYINNDQTTVIQYAKDIKLRIKLQQDEDEKIYIPLLIIEYKSRLVSYIQFEDETDSVTFTAEYTMDTDRFWEVASALFAVTFVIVILVWLLKVYSWAKRNPKAYLQDSYTGKLVYVAIFQLCNTWSFLYFWYLFAFCGYWFIFYKMQYHVYVLLPSLDDYQSNYLAFEALFGIVVSTQLLWMIYLILSQSSVDYLLLDWETPKSILRPGADAVKAIMAQIRGEAVDDSNFFKSRVSAWRSLFIANELNELQTDRYTSMKFSLIFMLFFLEGLGWIQLSSAQPNMDIDVSDGTRSPMNPILRFFLTSFLYLVIAYSQYLIRKILSACIATSSQEFIDLCSISNISLFIFDEGLHGYYIHGMAPNGQADGTIDELRKALYQESEGRARSRGIIEEDPELQTFEIYIPIELRRIYDNFMQSFDEVKQNPAKLSQEVKKWAYDSGVQANIQEVGFEAIRQKINRIFIERITNVIREAKTHVQQKTSLQRLLSLPPTDLNTFKGSPFFYKDPDLSFEKVILMGAEFNFILMEILVFGIVDLASENAFVAGLVTYIVSLGLQELRAMRGESNVSHKTLVDSRFLLQ